MRDYLRYLHRRVNRGGYRGCRLNFLTLSCQAHADPFMADWCLLDFTMDVNEDLGDATHMLVSTPGAAADYASWSVGGLHTLDVFDFMEAYNSGGEQADQERWVQSLCPDMDNPMIAIGPVLALQLSGQPANTDVIWDPNEVFKHHPDLNALMVNGLLDPDNEPLDLQMIMLNEEGHKVSRTEALSRLADYERRGAEDGNRRLTAILRTFKGPRVRLN